MFKIFFYINELKDIQKENLKKLKRVNLIYRNYSRDNYFEKANKIKEFANKFKFKLYVSNDLNLARKIKADGLYVPSFNSIPCYKNKNLEIIGSAHSLKEINQKILQGCNEIFLSPIFSTNSHPNTKGKGLYFYRNLKNSINKKINLFALGGIGEKNIKKLLNEQCKGFSSISLIEKKLSNRTIEQLNLIASHI